MAIRVLIVDDDAEFRRIVGSALADRGYEIAGESATLAEARKAICASRPDAVLLDINLPDGSGIALADELAETDRTLRVLLTSSDATAAGASPFVDKADLLTADLARYLG
jgi:DNA-binding NtrC family response regulator